MKTDTSDSIVCYKTTCCMFGQSVMKVTKSERVKKKTIKQCNLNALAKLLSYCVCDCMTLNK